MNLPIINIVLPSILKHNLTYPADSTNPTIYYENGTTMYYIVINYTHIRGLNVGTLNSTVGFLLVSNFGAEGHGFDFRYAT